MAKIKQADKLLSSYSYLTVCKRGNSIRGLISEQKGAVTSLTDNHECELEAFFDRLPVNLVGKIGETHITWYIGVDELKI